MTILIVNLWTGAPLVGLWLGSKLAGHDPWSMTAIGVVIAVLGASAFATAIAVSRLTEARDLIERRPSAEARPGWLRSLRERRPDDGVATPFRSCLRRENVLSMNNHREGAVLTHIQAPVPGDAPRRAGSGLRRRHIRLMVVDDHAAVRLGVVQLLECQNDLDVAVVCRNAEDAVAQPALRDVDVAIVDYHLGGRNGLWLCRRLKRSTSPPRVIVYSAFADEHLAACCSVAGADGMLDKGALGSELCTAARSVAHGRRSLPRVSPAMVEMLRRRLNDGEQQLFSMAMAGIPQREILRTLGMSARELDSREAAMLRKLEVTPGAA